MWLLEPLISKGDRLDFSFFVCLLKKQAHGHRGFSGFDNEEINGYGVVYCTRMAGGVRGSRCLGTEGSARAEAQEVSDPC